jgi:transcriptional regulator with PAS, ATPase and Fis domain
VGKKLENFFVQGSWEDYQSRCRQNSQYQSNISSINQNPWEKLDVSSEIGGKGWEDASRLNRERVYSLAASLYLCAESLDFNLYDCRLSFELKPDFKSFGAFFKSPNHSDADAYTLVWADQRLEIKKNGTRAKRVDADKKDMHAKVLNLDMSCGYIKLSSSDRTLIEYIDPLPIVEARNNRFGVWFDENPFTSMSLYKRVTKVDLEQLIHDALDVRLKVEPEQIFALHTFPVLRDPSPGDLQMFIFKKITQYRRLENTSTNLRLKVRSLETENVALRTKIDASYYNFITKNKTMLSTMETLKSVAVTPASVLLLGETGTGKDLVANIIHKISERVKKSFIKVDCATLSDNLLESELFGHEKGAFTGANERRIGRFELADQGTLFLDEIGNLNPTMQTKLLNVLQDKRFMRVGGSEEITTDVRIIAATNSNIEGMLTTGEFRNDLYYRLAGFVINVPPLRERPEDIPLLADHFLKIKTEYYKKHGLTFHNDTVHYLVNYTWPGNVRELENAVEYSIIKCQDTMILPHHLPFSNLSRARRAVPAEPGPDSRTVSVRPRRLRQRRQPKQISTSGKKFSVLSERQFQIIEVIQKQESCAAKTIEKALGLSQATIYNELMQLVDMGIVKKQGHSKNRRYLMV